MANGLPVPKTPFNVLLSMGAPVSPDCGPVGNAFNGNVKGVLLSIADDPKNSDHLVSPEDAINAAMGRQ
jgi:hypothetical protein